MYSLYTYPWNIGSQSPAEFSAKLRSLGADAVTLAASYHAGKFIHPQPGSEGARVYFPEDGTVYFRPRGDYGLLKPQLSQLTADCDHLENLCQHGDIPVNAWTVLFHNSRLGLAHPDACVANAFGDRYPYSLCPANPAVREYGVTLCGDMAEHYELNSLLLETPGYLTYAHGYHHEFAQIEENPWLDAWLGLCFCDHCIGGATQAGIDASGLQQRAKQKIDGFLNSDLCPDAAMAQGWLQADLLQDPDLAAFLQWRCEVVNSVVAEIRAAVRAEVAVKVIATCQRPHATAFWEGTDLATLRSKCDGLELPLYQSSANAVAADLYDAIQRIGSADGVSVVLRPAWPDMSSEGQLADTLKLVRGAGVIDIAFYNYGMMRPVNLSWIKNTLSC